MWSFKLCPFILIGMTPLHLGDISKVDFTTVIIMLLLTVSSVSKNEPSLCMNNCLSKSQQYNREYLFWMSMPWNKILVSGSMSHMMKVCENLKFAMHRCKAALPSDKIDYPSAVLGCTSAGRILVL